MKTAWLASQLLDGVSNGDPRRVRSTGRVIGHLERRLHRFDPSTQERVELLGALSSSAQSGVTPPVHFELLRHLARTLLVQSVHGAS